MTRYAKKNQLDGFADAKHQRFHRKARGHKFAIDNGDKFEKRHSWGYAKRRTLVTE
jgi:hypothetical protein